MRHVRPLPISQLCFSADRISPGVFKLFVFFSTQTASEGGTKDGASGIDAKSGQVGGAGIGERRTRGFPRIIKAGHGTKLGHVVR